MRQKLRGKRIVLIALVAAPVMAFSQQGFSYRTAIPAVPETKFYAIELAPALLASCATPELADLRLVDSAGKTVPYLMKLNSTVNTATRLVPYRIVSNVRRDSSSEITIRNETPGPLRSLSLIIKNASAYRTGMLSGSDDNQAWYVIDDHVEINPLSSSSGDQFVQQLDFPLSNYRYFKLTISDRGLPPLNILQAGVSQYTVQAGKYLDVPVRRFIQLDSSDHYTYLTLQFAQAYKIDRLRLRISRPSLYKRNYSVNAVKPLKESALEQGDLRPGMDSILLSTKSGELLVTIYNGDNPPLLIDGVQAYQAERQMVAQLEKNKPYFVLSGNAHSSIPDYDLEFFRDSIFSNLSVVNTGPVTRNQAAFPGAKAEKSSGKVIMWVAIAAVLLLLLWFTFRMSKEIGKKSTE